tara:strand:- start:241 stop:693 length:453 start_codon:yes stop_codon:yes gene_type:complete
MAASRRHAAGESRRMTKAQWDELSNKDKYDLYSGYKPKKEKEQGRFAGGKETPAKKATSPAAARSKAMAARKAETAKKRGTGSRTGALASARKAGRKKAASKYDQSVHQVGATKSKSKHTKKSAPTSSSRFPKGGGRRSARAGSRFTSDY